MFVAIKSPLALIVPEDVISPKAFTLKLPNEADVASINPLALILPFIFKEPVMKAPPPIASSKNGVDVVAPVLTV